ncbi:ankyrin repeat domain-containing protein [Clostridium thermarum]|uniref:ankyrin repeat domain-containing protein n=1 Tax=Clostridium thermarum TaxID=1716543 RepID=UPI0013D3C092|nr:ankyrin repeat domain-containing protein [Clostridium thermarum]
MGIFDIFGGRAKNHRANLYKLIKKRKIDELKEILVEGFNLNEKIPVKDHEDMFPLTCALMYKSYDIVRLFIDNGAELNNEEEPAIIYSAIYGDAGIIQHIVACGADINMVDTIRGSALSCALGEENFEGLKVLINSGIDMVAYGGSALRDAAREGFFDAAELLISSGADVNYNKAEGVYLSEISPIQVAAQEGYEDIVHLLLRHGADSTLLNNNENQEETIINMDNESKEDYIEIEEKHRHDYQWHVEKLREYGLQEEIIQYLGTSNKMLNLSDKSDCTRYIVFCTVDQVRVFSWRDILFIDLLSEVEGYDENGVLAWLPESQCFGTLDLKSNRFGKIEGLTWKTFLEYPGRYIDGSIRWEFCQEFDYDGDEPEEMN